EQAVARLALANGLLGLSPLRDVAQADHEDLPPADPRVADRQLDREGMALLVPTPRLGGGQIEVRVAGGGRKPLQILFHAAVLADTRDQQVDALAKDFRLAVAEHALAGGIEGLDDAALVDRENDVLDVIQDDLQMLRALLVHFARKRARLGGHQSQRQDDASALFGCRAVMGAYRPQGRAEPDWLAPPPH